MFVFLIIAYVFSSTKRNKGRTGSAWKWGRMRRRERRLGRGKE
jgi:hypothetical protein